MPAGRGRGRGVVGDDVPDGGRLTINVGSGFGVVCDQAGSKGLVSCMGERGKTTVHKSKHRSTFQMDRTG